MKLKISKIVLISRDNTYRITRPSGSTIKTLFSYFPLAFIENISQYQTFLIKI